MNVLEVYLLRARYLIGKAFTIIVMAYAYTFKYLAARSVMKWGNRQPVALSGARTGFTAGK